MAKMNPDINPHFHVPSRIENGLTNLRRFAGYRITRGVET